MKDNLFVVLCLLVSTSILGQKVGVQTATPEQTVHVQGKLKVEDDNHPPTRGTIRYTPDDFEGFTGSGWTSFTKQANSNLPSNPIPVYGYSFAISVGEANQQVTFHRYSDLTSFSTVPIGKFLLITSVLIEPNGIDVSGTFEATFGRAVGGTVNQFSAHRVLGNQFSEFYKDPFGILCIVRGGETFRMTNESSSDFTINIKVRGFLVDDLDF